MNTKRMLLCAALLSPGLGAGTAALADPPDWAPAHGYRAKRAPVEREHRYVYYPAQQVYYAPETSTWFWINGGTWQFGMNLPSQVHVAVNSGGVPVMLPTERPYVEHMYVEENYGRPWREKHRHELHDRDDRRDRHDRDDHDRGRHRN